MEQAIRELEYPLVEIAKFREVSLKILNGGDSVVVLAFCPWCGSKLPASLRHEWFDELERGNIDPYGPEVPREFDRRVVWGRS
jgi:hypothetical protein